MKPNLVYAGWLAFWICVAHPSAAVECWKLVYTASQTDPDALPLPSNADLFVYDVQYRACIATEPNEPGLCSCYSGRRPVGRFWRVLPERGSTTSQTSHLDARPAWLKSRPYLWHLSEGMGKDTDTEQIISRRILSRLEGSPCQGGEDTQAREGQAKGGRP